MTLRSEYEIHKKLACSEDAEYRGTFPRSGSEKSRDYITSVAPFIRVENLLILPRVVSFVSSPLVYPVKSTPLSMGSKKIFYRSG